MNLNDRAEFDAWILHLCMKLDMHVLASGIVEGNMPRLENRPQIMTRTTTAIKGKPRNSTELRKSLVPKKRIIYMKSKDAREYASPTIAQLNTQKTIDMPYDRPVAVYLRVFYRTPITSGSGADLNGELFYNLMQCQKGKKQGAGLISDDRWIGEKHLIRRFDKENPRVEWAITELTTRAE